MIGRFYGTFGTGHEYAGCFVEIHAQDIHCARAFMIKAHGTRWSSVYDENQFAGQQERYGLMRLALVRQRPTGPRDEPFFDTDRSIGR